ncbi:MAG: peroxiredoxin [Deltaproteobacteria bacterium]|nr:peroxiredoxin [Deltaproteobacteria bacterium]
MSLPTRSALLLLALAACKDAPPAPAGPASQAAPGPAAAPAAPATPAADTAPLAVGDPAPEMTMTLHDGKVVTLASYAASGKRVLVYFYPKDDTPGCTVEAQGLRDRHADLEAAGLVVLGVSTQDAASHAAFIDKHDLPFPLVVDTDGAVAKAFRVPLRASGLAARQSFLVGRDGKLEQVWLEVDPATHAADVLAALQ